MDASGSMQETGGWIDHQRKAHCLCICNVNPPFDSPHPDTTRNKFGCAVSPSITQPPHHPNTPTHQ